MKLYYKSGACSMAAHIVLNEVGANYVAEKVDTSTGATETGANYKSINPRGYVPAIVLEDDTVITENAAILQYLADQWPQSALAPPTTHRDRYRLQELLSFLSSELHKAFSPYFSGRDLSDAEKDTAFAKLSRQLDHVESLLSDGRQYLVGDTFTVADAYAFVILNWTNFIGVSLANWPKSKAFLERHAQRPSVQTTLEQEGLVAA